MTNTWALVGIEPHLHWHDTAILAQHSSAALVHSTTAFFHGVAHQYQHGLETHPLWTKMITGGSLATMGDAMAQRQTNDRYDVARAGSFMTFDMCYRALQHYAFPVIVHECHGQYLGGLILHTPLAAWISIEHLATMERTLASQLGIVPFIYYPVFYTMTALIQNLPPQAAVTRAKETFLPLMKKNLKFWIPIQFLQFGFVDDSLQIPFLSAAGLAWTCILSLAAGSTKRYTNQQDSQNAIIPSGEEEPMKVPQPSYRRQQTQTTISIKV